MATQLNNTDILLVKKREIVPSKQEVSIVVLSTIGKSFFNWVKSTNRKTEVPSTEIMFTWNCNHNKITVAS